MNGLQRRITASVASIEGRLSELSDSMKQRLTDQHGPAIMEGSASESLSSDQDLDFQKGIKTAQELYASAHYREAVQKLEPLLKMQPANADVQLYLAASLFNANPGDSASYARVEQILRAVIDNRGESLMALTTMGGLCMERGRWAEGIDWFSRAAVQEPESVEILRNAGTCSLYAGELVKAQALFDKAASLSPSDADLWYFAGSAYAGAGNHGASLERLRKCLALQPRHLKARLLIGQSLQAQGQFDSAIDYLSEYLAAKRDFSALVALGDCYQAEGKRADAEARWKLALEMIDQKAPDKTLNAGGVYERLARAAWDRNDPTSCMAYAMEGTKLEAAPVLQVYLGVSYRALGDNAKGVALLRHVQEAFPDTEAARFAAKALDQAVR